MTSRRPRYTLAPFLVGAALTLAACGVFGDAAGDAGADSLAVTAATGDSLGATASTAGDSGPPPAGEPADAQVSGPDAAGPGAGETVTGGAGAPNPPTAEGGAQAVTQDPVALQLELIVANQVALNRRLDSLAARFAPPDSAERTESGEVLGEATQTVQSFGVGVAWSIVIFVLFGYAVRSLVWLLDALAERSPRRRLFYKKLVPIVRILLWILAAYIIVSVIFRVDAQGIFAAAAAVGVAIGFAAQDLLKNLFGGLILVFDQPFQAGDKISVGGTYGEVVSIGLRSTRIQTPDDNLVSVPNAQVVDQQVANANAGELHCQVVTDLFLPGWIDESTAKKIAFQAAASSSYVYLNKPIVVLVSDVFKETFLTRIRVKAYVLDPRLEFLFQSDVTERARAGFREAGLLTREDLRLLRVHATAAPAEETTDRDGETDPRGAAGPEVGHGG